MNTSPKFPADIRSPLEALRDLMDQAEMLARHIADGNPELAGHMEDLIDQLLPAFVLVTEAEEVQASLNRDREDRETEAFYEDEKAMYRPQRV